MSDRILTWVVVLILLAPFVAILAIYNLRQSRNAVNDELKPTFERFEKCIEAKNYEEAYRMTTTSYQSRSSLSEFSSRFQTIKPLSNSWTVLKEGPNSVRICCSAPGIPFSPSSTMTYVFERSDTSSNWLFSGESQMWLD